MNRIKEMRKAKGYTQEKLATLLHTTQANLSGWEAGKWKPDTEAVAQMADIFGVSVDYLLGRDDTAPRTPNVKGIYPLDDYGKIPVLGIIRGGLPICTDQGEYDTAWADKKFVDGKHFMVRVQGDSMSPTIPNGAWAIIEHTDVALPGQVVAFALDGEYATLKRYYPQEDGSIILKGDNPKNTFEFHITQEQLKNGEAHIVGVCRHVKFDL